MYLTSLIIGLHEENRYSILTVKLVSSKFAFLLVIYLGQSNKKCCSFSIKLRLHCLHILCSLVKAET